MKFRVFWNTGKSTDINGIDFQDAWHRAEFGAWETEIIVSWELVHDYVVLDSHNKHISEFLPDFEIGFVFVGLLVDNVFETNSNLYAEGMFSRALVISTKEYAGKGSLPNDWELIDNIPNSTMRQVIAYVLEKYGGKNAVSNRNS